MRATFAILICCLYALSAVEGTPSSKSESAEVQQGNAKAASPLKFWSDDKSGDDGKDAKDDKVNKDDNDDCASQSVAVLIGTSTYAIPCLKGDSIVNLNGLIPTSISSIASSSATEASSSAASSSAASSSEASFSTESTTTTTDSTTTTTAATTSTHTTTTTTTTTLPTGTNLILYDSVDCTGDIIFSNSGLGCFNNHLLVQNLFSARSSANTNIDVKFFDNENCTGNLLSGEIIPPGGCAENISILTQPIYSFSVTGP